MSAAFDDAPEPDALSVVDVAEGAEDAGVGCAESAIELVEGERRASLEQLAGGPSGVVRVSEQELLELGHKGIIDAVCSGDPPLQRRSRSTSETAYFSTSIRAAVARTLRRCTNSDSSGALELQQGSRD